MEKTKQQAVGDILTDEESARFDRIAPVSDGDSDGYSNADSYADVSKPLLETSSIRRDTLKDDATAGIASTSTKYPGTQVILDLYPPKNYGEFLADLYADLTLGC